MPRVCYNYKMREKNVQRWFKQRTRCFLYYYNVDNWENPLENEWQNLNKLFGCSYHGWIKLSDRIRGELWTFKTNKHRVLLQMQISSNQLMFKEQFLIVQKEIDELKKRLRRDKVHLVPDDIFLF